MDCALTVTDVRWPVMHCLVSRVLGVAERSTVSQICVVNVLTNSTLDPKITSRGYVRSAARYSRGTLAIQNGLDVGGIVVGRVPEVVVQRGSGYASSSTVLSAVSRLNGVLARCAKVLGVGSYALWRVGIYTIPSRTTPGGKVGQRQNDNGAIRVPRGAGLSCEFGNGTTLRVSGAAGSRATTGARSSTSTTSLASSVSNCVPTRQTWFCCVKNAIIGFIATRTLRRSS